MALANAADVQIRLFGQSLSDEEIAVVEVRLGDVERLLLSRIPDLLTKAASDTVLHDNVVMVEAEAVLRLIRNPEGHTQESDNGYSYMISQLVASGRLHILNEEWALLGKRQGAFVIAPQFKLPGSTGMESFE